jgi:hypothetical protein
MAALVGTIRCATEALALRLGYLAGNTPLMGDQ